MEKPGGTGEQAGEAAASGAPAGAANTEFADALREATAAKGGKGADTTAAASAGAKTDDKPDPKDKAAAGNAGGSDGKGKSDAGADTAAQGKTPAGADTAAGKATDKAPNNAAIEVDWSKVDPAVKAAYDAGTPETRKSLETLVRGNLQRGHQIAELKGKLSQNRGHRRPASTGGNPAKLKTSAAAMRQAFDSKAVKDLEADAPEAVAALRAALEPVIATTEESAKMLEGVAADGQLDEVELQEAILAEEHPDWEAVTASPEFDAWSKGAPKYIQDAIVANSRRSEQFPNGRLADGQQAAMVLTAFKNSKSTTAEGDEPPADGHVAAEGSEATSPVERKRQRQRESAETPALRGAAALTGPSADDFAGALRQATREKEAEKRRSAERRV
jgi:hypothetical protein